MPYVEVPGGRLYYETAGSPAAPALLLIHQGVANLRMWDEQVAAFAREHFVVRYDARGFGLSETEDVAFSPSGDIRALLDRLGVASVAIIANSQGGNFAFDLALESPERVRGLMAIGSACSGFPELPLTAEEEAGFARLDRLYAAADWPALARGEVELWNLRSDGSPLDPAFVQRAYALNEANLPHAAERPTRVPIDPPAYGRLGELRIPVLAAVGEWDLSEAHTQAKHFAAVIPGAEFHVFPRAAHLPSVQHPAEFEAVALDWLGRHGL
ncbi:MAG TPA: alpha/beta fold hydrolase [Gryllotalpicola sp.]